MVWEIQMQDIFVRSRGWLAVVCLAALAVAGCSGAEARKARHLAKGQSYLAAGNLEKARVEFRNALQIKPTDAEARFENGVIDEKLGNMREAAQFYQGVIDVSPDNVTARARLGRIYAISGSPDRAMATIAPGLAKHLNDANLLTVRAAARVQLKDSSGALQDAELATKLAPDNEDAVAVLAGIYKLQGQTEKAQALLQNAIKRDPNTVDLRLTLAQLDADLGKIPEVEQLFLDLMRLQPKEKSHRLRLAQFYARNNQVDEAERVLRDGVKALPDERDLKTALVDFLAARRGRDVADKELNVLIAANPNDYELKFLQARFYEQGKEFDKAAAVYANVIAAAGLEAPGLTARNRLAALRVQLNDVPAAEKLIAEVLAKSPRDDDALLLRGSLALAQHDARDAIADLRSVLRDQPNAVGVMRALARAHLANGEPALAEETMRHASELQPTNQVVRLDLAQLLAQLGKPEQAKPVIDELVKEHPDNVQALDTQFNIALATKDLVTAQTAADAIVATRPKAPTGYFYQGEVAEASKRPDDALRLYAAALDLAPQTQEPLQGIARVLVAMKRTPEALKRLDEAIASDPKAPFAANLKGEILLASNRPEEAVAAFKLATERDPKWAVAYRNLALAKLGQKDPAGAVASLQLGIANATEPEALEAELATLDEHLGKPDEAIQVYEDGLRRDPKSEGFRNNLAMLLVTYKKDPASLARAKELSASFATSDNPNFLDTYGWVLYKRGEAAAAVSALQNAIAKTADSPVYLYHLGMAEALAGQPESARDSLTRSLQSGQDFAGKDEAKATLDKLAKSPSASATPSKS
jgi:tetratricopeptide (TPR) repeat protein